MKTLNHPSEYLPMPRKTISLALLGLLFLLGTPANSQAEVTAIAKTAVELEDLIVTTAWPESAPPDQLEIAVFDENDLQIAAQLVWPRPGEDTETTFDDFLHNLAESGFQFSAIVRDAEGREVSERLAFRVVIECPLLTEPCQWSTQDGLYTTAIAITEPLRAALEALETRGSQSLLEDVLAEQPDLRGPVFTLAAQLDRLNQKLGLEGSCACAWYHSFRMDPDDRECKRSDPELPGNSSRSWTTVEGDGTYAFAKGDIEYPAESLWATAGGASEQTLGLICLEIRGWIEDTSLWPIRVPIAIVCSTACHGTVESSATFDYRLSTDADPRSLSLASAYATSSLERDDGTNYPPKVETWHESLHHPDDTLSEVEGSGQLPTIGAFVDTNVRELTIKLSGTATVYLQTAGEKSWSSGTALLEGLLLKVKGHAACAVEPMREATLRASNTIDNTQECGEQLIEDWDVS